MATLLAERASAIQVHDPDDGALVGEIETTSASALDQALTRGVESMRRAHMPAHERSQILSDVAARVAAQAESHAILIATEGVKTIREARREVARCVETLRLSAEEAKRIGGNVLTFDQSPTGAGRIGWWSMRPAGLVAAITPFNDPLNLVAHKLGPAFALGAPIVIKPHPQTPFSALRLVEHFHESGAPVDSVQIVIGGAALGAKLVSDPRPSVVSFTGGRVAGAEIAARVGGRRLMLELGGVGIVAVCVDADIERAAALIHSGAFWAAGQNCVHAQRIIADRRIADGLRERLRLLALGIRCGPKRSEDTDMGPVVDTDSVRRVLGYVDRARAAGGRVLSGGTATGNCVAPTWIDELPFGHPLLDEETFGPVSTFETASDDAQIIEKLGAAPAAIHAALFTASVDVAFDAFDRVNSAALIVNDSTDFRIDAMPFGGAGSAGLGREGVADAIAEMAEKKMIVFKRTLRADADRVGG